MNAELRMHYMHGKVGNMTDTHAKLLQLLMMHGNKHVAEILEISESEASRKLSGDTGIKLKQLAELFDDLGIKLAGKNDVVVSKAKYSSLVELSAQQLETEKTHLTLVTND